jgi:hypothetical protein
MLLEGVGGRFEFLGIVNNWVFRDFLRGVFLSVDSLFLSFEEFFFFDEDTLFLGGGVALTDFVGVSFFGFDTDFLIEPTVFYLVNERAAALFLTESLILIFTDFLEF